MTSDELGDESKTGRTREPIFTIAWDCDNLMRKCIHQARGDDAHLGARLDDYERRFTAWWRFLGVFAERKANLDRRLHRQPDIRDIVVRLLLILRRNLAQLHECQGQLPQGTLPNPTHTAALVRESEEETLDGGDVAALAAFSLEAIDECLVELGQVAIAIRHSSKTTETMRARRVVSEKRDLGRRLQSFEALAFLALETLYPNAPESLLFQLGRSMVDRYARLLFRALRHNVLSEDIREPLRSDTPTPQPHGVTSHKEHLVAREKEATRNGIPAEATAQVAPTLPLSSINLSKFQDQLKKIQVPKSQAGTTFFLAGTQEPPVPQRNDFGKFECVWCFDDIDSDHFQRGNWTPKGREHYRKDLEPFVCLSEDCADTVPTFASLKAWNDHMAQHQNIWTEHIHSRRMWRCDIEDVHESEALFSTADDLLSHIRALHPSSWTTFQGATRAELSQQFTCDVFRNSHTCPLCCLTPKGLEEVDPSDRLLVLEMMEKHLAEHLQNTVVLSLRLIETQNTPLGEEGGRSESSMVPGDTSLGSHADHSDSDSEVTSPSILTFRSRSLQTASPLQSNDEPPKTNSQHWATIADGALDRRNFLENDSDPILTHLRAHQNLQAESSETQDNESGSLVTPADKRRFDTIFVHLDQDDKGFLSGEEALLFFSKSNLDNQTLAQVWDLADTEGRLNREEFAVAMSLIQQKQAKPDWSLPPPENNFSLYIEKYINDNDCRGFNGVGEKCGFASLKALRDYWNPDKILDVLCEAPDTQREQINVDPKRIYDKYLIVFSVLVSIGHPQHIISFTDHQLDDTKLPLNNIPKVWSETDEQVQVYRLFEKEQWTFYPLTFDYKPYRPKLVWNQIIPITKNRRLQPVADSGDDVFVFEATVHPDCRGSLPVTIVLKEYHGGERDAEILFKNEVAVYSNLREDSFDNIVRYYGSFEQVGVRTVVLEYADGGTLANFFARTNSIERPDDRIRFWKGFLGLLRGLDDIHNLRQPDTDRGKWLLKATHQDIRPQNILVFKGDTQNPYDVRFKWTDFGTGHVRRCRSRGLDPLGQNNEGNTMYSAPECCRDDHNLRPVLGQSDVWSFGGVASEALIWSILGERERCRYQDMRSEENSCGVLTGGLHEGCFHDGECLLPIVEQMHSNALQSKFPNDNISVAVSELIITKMLVADPGERPDAITVHRIWERWQLSPTTATINHYPFTSHINGRGREPVAGSPFPPHASLDRELPDYTPVATNGTFRNSTAPSDDTLGIRQYPPPPPPLSIPHYTAPHNSHFLSPPSLRTPELMITPPDNGIHYIPEPEYRYSGYEPTHVPGHQLNGIMDNITGFPLLLTQQPLSQAREPPVEPPSRSILREPTQPQGPSDHRNEPVAARPNSRPVSGPVLRPIPRPSSTRRPVSLSSLIRSDKITVNEIWSKCIKHKKRKWRPSNAQPDLLTQFPALKEAMEQVKGPGGRARDQIYLVDDSASMEQHRDQVGKTCRVLSYMAKRAKVNNAFELYYTVDVKTVEFSTTEPIQHSIDMHQFSQTRYSPARTLDAIISTVLRRSRPVSIYVLTNGEWDSDLETDLCSVNKTIMRLVKHIADKNKEENWAGIQFIRFYNPNSPDGSQLGKARLQYLDDELPKELKQRGLAENDIVDTCDWDEDVRRMVLGCVVRGED
ncbi:hypothetical protein GQ53DRAFT_843190 [Thozetella sp. PMI_491]|nr:hypothetical protein GQ53DRAFT_843190 [Thozetella sp. PMI_491]